MLRKQKSIKSLMRTILKGLRSKSTKIRCSAFGKRRFRAPYIYLYNLPYIYLKIPLTGNLEGFVSGILLLLINV